MSAIKTSRPIFMIMLVTGFLILSGCSSRAGYYERSGQTVGAFVGQVIGEASGSRYPVARILGSTAAGAYIGGRIGRSMDERDRQRAYYALEHGRNNHSTRWTNSSTQNRYVITPAYGNRNTNNLYCRSYATEAYVQGQKVVYYGYACRGQDGYWRDARR